ncbi:MAG: hypothetical protein ACPG5W_02710, partial [Flavobacteriales bacterium]
MYKEFQEDNLSLTEAKEAAERLSFYPMMFQAAVSLNRTGILLAIVEAGRKGITSEELAEKTGVSQYGVETLLEAGLSLNLVKLIEPYKYKLGKTGS